MSIAEILSDWKDYASTTATLKTFRSQLAELETDFNDAQVRFQKRLQDLDEEERATITEIIAAYEGDIEPPAPAGKSGKKSNSDHDFSLKWLLNKVGNEGVDGIKWPRILNAWQKQFSETPTDVLYQALNTNRHLFAMTGERQEATLKLTSEGHSQFLNSA